MIKNFSTIVSRGCIDLCFVLRMQLNNRQHQKNWIKKIPKEFIFIEKYKNKTMYKVNCIYCHDKIKFLIYDLDTK